MTNQSGHNHNEEQEKPQAQQVSLNHEPPAAQAQHQQPEQQPQQHEETELQQTDQIEKLRQEVEQWKDKYLRALAELENLRKQMRKEAINRYEAGVRQVCYSLLDVLDDIEAAFKQLEQTTEINAVKEGLSLVHKKFLKVLEEHGIEPIHALHQPFDPERHEAVMMIETQDEEQHGKVIEELKKGYLMRGELVRPAKVVVAILKTHSRTEHIPESNSSESPENNEEPKTN